MRFVLLAFLFVVSLGLAAFWNLTSPDHVAAEEVATLTGDPIAGETVFWAAGCASCHAAEDAEGEARLILAGGQAFPSEFGIFYAPNISTDPTAGIGDWTLVEFVNALQNGVSPEGQHYYPAFPYTAYRLATRQDLADLYAFMATLPADSTPSLAHDVAFPFSVRRFVGLWNQFHLSDTFALPEDGLSEAELRGRYLSEALAHCAECHTPRNAFGGLARASWMEGTRNPVGTGTIPPLTPDRLTWSEGEIAAYLNDGFTPEFDSAGGHMASVIRNLSQLEPSDRQAIAAYLKALPPAE